MQTWIVWTDAPVTDTELRRFAEKNGGYWNDAVGDEAVIERGNARVFMGTAMANDRSNVTAEDVDRATSKRGSTPVSMVSLTIGHAEGSSELAEDIARRVINAWGGLLDYNTARS